MASDAKNQSLIQEFREQFALFCGQLPYKAFFLGLLAMWLLLFQFLGHCSFNFTQSSSLFAWMWGAYSAPALDSSHGKLIPIVVLVLLWLKRDVLLKSIARPWWPALLGVAMALLLHIFGYIGQQPRISIVGLFFGIWSLVGLTWGWRALKVAFLPFTFFIFAIPFGNTLDQLTFPLRMLATKVSWLFAHGVLGLPIIQQGTQLINQDLGYTYDIVAACSGIHSIIPLLAITSIYGMLNFRTTGKRTLIVISAIPLALICNVLRVIAIIIARHGFGEAAAHFVHEWFGFVTYVIALGSVFALGYFHERHTKPAQKPSLEAKNA